MAGLIQVYPFGIVPIFDLCSFLSLVDPHLLSAAMRRLKRPSSKPKKKAALEKLEKGEAPGSDSEDHDDDKIDETEEAGNTSLSLSLSQHCPEACRASSRQRRFRSDKDKT